MWIMSDLSQGRKKLNPHLKGMFQIIRERVQTHFMWDFIFKNVNRDNAEKNTILSQLVSRQVTSARTVHIINISQLTAIKQ